LALHQLIYASAAAGVIHYRLWLVKADRKKPLEYACVLAALLGCRLVVWLSQRAKATAGDGAGAKVGIAQG